MDGQEEAAGPPAEAIDSDPAALLAQANEVLVRSGQTALTEDQMQAFDTVWANPSTA